jgi:hypothetical protein
MHFTSRAEVEADARDALARANEAVPRWFGRLPVTTCEVVPMPAHEEENSSIAYYRQAALDGSRPGQYYINTSHPETRPRYESRCLAYHESVPGHHLQIAIGQELTKLPDFRRHLGPTAFFEGWGLYTERLADEMGLYATDVDRLGMLSMDAWRPVARRRYRDARVRLDAAAGDRLHDRSPRSRRTTSPARSTVTSPGRHGPWATRPASSRSSPSAARPSDRPADGSTSVPSTTPCSGTGPCRWPPSGPCQAEEP